jgi:hypothetical protein
MIVGIVVDDWKLPVFRRQLETAGFAYTDGGGPIPGVTALKVETDNLLALKCVVEACQLECAKDPRYAKPR